MTDVILTRFLYGRDATFGVMHQGDLPLCLTLEDPWKNNQRGVSCIPTGKYSCVRHNGAKYKDVWVLQDVPGRSAILIHQGNTAQNTEGCILVGTEFYKDLPGIGRSTEALNFLRMVLPDKFTLTIRDFQSRSGSPQLVHNTPPQPSP